MKKKKRIVHTILRNYYRDMGIMALYRRQIELLEYGINNSSKPTDDSEKIKINTKIASLNEKIEKLKFKNCQIHLIVSSIKAKDSVNANILDMKFKKGYLSGKISLELHFNESTVWEKENNMYDYIYQCLDDESILDAETTQEKRKY